MNFQTEVVNELKLRGWTVVLTQGKVEKGVPDLFVAREGSGSFWAEVKDTGDRLSPQQIKMISRLLDAGVKCYVFTPKNFWALLEGGTFD
jgi:hypothetical protein